MFLRKAQLPRPYYTFFIEFPTISSKQDKLLKKHNNTVNAALSTKTFWDFEKFYLSN